MSVRHKVTERNSYLHACKATSSQDGNVWRQRRRKLHPDLWLLCRMLLIRRWSSLWWGGQVQQTAAQFMILTKSSCFWAKPNLKHHSVTSPNSLFSCRWFVVSLAIGPVDLLMGTLYLLLGQERCMEKVNKVWRGQNRGDSFHGQMDDPDEGVKVLLELWPLKRGKVVVVALRYVSVFQNRTMHLGRKWSWVTVETSHGWLIH